MKSDILGVKIDNVSLTEALAMTEKWICDSGKHYIVTSNLEFILAAQNDPEFKQILNKADLAIPDSSSLGFSYWLLKRNILARLLLWPLFFTPLKQVMPFDRVFGTDFMEALCKLAAEKGFIVGFLGGQDGVAKKTTECLLRKYPRLRVAFADSGGDVDDDGNVIASPAKDRLRMTVGIDILFVAFGHIKQEKWIAKNLDKIPVKIAMGVGGAFDYLSGSVPRAPKWIRELGFEWLFRLVIQPWRIKRQLALVKYLWLIIFKE